MRLIRKIFIKSNNYFVVSKFEFELLGGAETSQEDVLEVDKWSDEGAVVESRHQGPREHVGCAAEEGGECVWDIEGGWQVPLARGVPDRIAVHHMPYQGVVNIGGDNHVVVVVVLVVRYADYC